MEGIKLIDASDVVEGSIKKSKMVKKPLGGKLLPGPTKEIIDLDKKSDVKPVVNVIESDKKTGNEVESDKKTGDGIVSGRTIRALKLKQDIYYGENDINKKQFVKMYKKKELGLRWIENTSVGGEIVNCWINQDRSQYIIKLPEEGEYKRFKFYGCDEIYNFFVSLGAISFDYTKEKIPESTRLTNHLDKTNVDKVEEQEKCEFIGADLWSGYRTRQLLKGMPDNWGIKWK